MKHDRVQKGTDVFGDADYYCNNCKKYATQMSNPWGNNCSPTDPLSTPANTDEYNTDDQST